MNNLITTKSGDVINMRLVISDQKDIYGHTLIIRHVNDLQDEIEKLKKHIKVVKAASNDMVRELDFHGYGDSESIANYTRLIEHG